MLKQVKLGVVAKVVAMVTKEDETWRVKLVINEPYKASYEGGSDRIQCNIYHHLPKTEHTWAIALRT